MITQRQIIEMIKDNIFYLSDHRKSHDEKGNATTKSEEWFVST